MEILQSVNVINLNSAVFSSLFVKKTGPVKDKFVFALLSAMMIYIFIDCFLVKNRIIATRSGIDWTKTTTDSICCLLFNARFIIRFVIWSEGFEKL